VIQATPRDLLEVLICPVTRHMRQDGLQEYIK